MSGPQRQSMFISENDSMTRQRSHLETSDLFESWLKDLKPDFEPSEAVAAKLTRETVTPPTILNELRFEGTLRLDCEVNGSLRSHNGTLEVSDAGQVGGNLDVAVAIINGRLNGDIHASGRVEIGEHGVVIGNIETPAISIHEGGVFEGECVILPNHPNFNAIDEAKVINLPVSVDSAKPTGRSSTETPDESEQPLAAAAGR